MRLLLSLWASAVAVTHAATSSTGSATCDVGGPVTLTVSGTSAVVTDSTCTTSKTIAVTTLPKTNRTLAVAGYGIEQVRSVPDIDTLDLTYNHATSIADLSDYAKIKRLVLANNNLKSTQLITWPSTLLQLDLSNNPLQPPLDLSSMRSLDQLVLTNTSLSDLSKITFPTALTQMTASFNGMSKFPQSAAVSSLKTLTLNGNSIASFGDITIPPALESLDLSWNQISSFTGLKLPTTVKKLFLGGNKFTSLADLKTTNALTVLYVHDMSLGNLAGVSFPSTVTALSLMNCSLTTMSNVTLPSSLLYLDVSNNQLTALPTKYPDTLKSLTANTNSLTELSRISFPTSTTKLDFAGNKIAKVSGVSFPFVLEELYFGDFPVNEIEIKRSDLATIQKLKSLSLTVTQSACSNAAAQATTVNRTRFCVIPDDVFAKQYSSSTDVTSPSSSKGSGGWVLPVVIGAAVLAVIGLAVFIVRRRKAQHHHAAPKLPIGGADYSQTLANPSVFGDLPSFDNDHKNPMQQVTLNNMNSYSTMFTGSNGSNGSSGTESSLLKYRIPTHEITLKKAIAHGGFGAVYLALYQMQDVVVKKILPEKASDDRCLQAFLDEIKLCSTLNHPKVVRFIGVSWNTLSDIAVVLEYMAYGDLDTLLKQQAARHSTHPDEFGWYQSTNNLPCKSAIALDILDAVVYLHSFSSPIIHRDLKAKNVLLSQHYEAKLSDFGVSKEWRVDATMTAGIGTMAWIAPEVLRGERYTEKADIYSFGVILTELATCAKPFEGITNALIVLKVTSGEQRPDMGTNCPSDIKELGLRCLSYNPGDRPSAMVAHYELKTLLKAHTRFEL